jgi:hypothetical protein
MKKQSLEFLLSLLFILTTTTLLSQANITIENNSKRTMTVKVMNGYGSGVLYKTVTISPYGNSKIYFSESGYYFTKTKAVLSGRDPIYRKGEPFEVVNDSNGYSELTLTFSITESTIPTASGGKQISKTEFDKN